MATAPQAGSYNPYETLLQFSNAYARTLSELNAGALGAIRDGGLASMATMTGIAVSASVPNLDASIHAMQEALRPLAVRYQDLLTRDANMMNAPTAAMLGQLHVSTAALLDKLPKTELASAMADCFARAQYQAMPQIVSKALAANSLAASDIAFLRLSELVSLMGDGIAYPRGFKTSLNQLNVTTAKDLAAGEGIAYSTRDNLFCHGSSRADSRTMNVVSAGRSILQSSSSELFSEGELVDFVSELASTPMLAGMTNTGQRIYDWLEGMFRIGEHSMGFDQDTYYHCRTRSTGDMPFTWEEMQRAPHGIPGTGRFNTPGSAYFYFASTRQGAENEIRKYLREGESLQTVCITPSGSANLLDLSHTLQRGKTFLRMIRFELSEASQSNKFPREYLLPCYVANCCKRIGYDGIAYHGAKGYTNYVTWNDGWFSFAGMC